MSRKMENGGVTITRLTNKGFWKDVGVASQELSTAISDSGLSKSDLKCSSCEYNWSWSGCDISRLSSLLATAGSEGEKNDILGEIAANESSGHPSMTCKLTKARPIFLKLAKMSKLPRFK